ncbi:MAG TPA: peptidase C1 [Phycisphaerae bacterium]|nr:peptidase C1 [Phycisphaerae bacterium]HOJ74766.1 peptidase C1 [Phycisphaerae bacterium]HOM52135.1 peptidase C1 [Phycisphaerae bacterium]HON66340.1 peptidase C1 [Phycisphaerae bacterium]HOQ85895.1 peptidase C1 [Phycisphaerae bacterium]
MPSIGWSARWVVSAVLATTAVGTARAAEPVEAVSRRRGTPVFVEDVNRTARELTIRLSGPDAVSPPRLQLKSTLDGLDVPVSPSEFRTAWHYPPVLQGLTGNCWAYGSTSYLESEIHRLSGHQIKLSEMHTVYWEYVEKARRFVRERGKSAVPRGSEANATLRIWKEYGVVPADAYTGLPAGRDFHADRKMYDAIVARLNAAAGRGDWNEEKIIAAVRSILDKHMGRPPERIKVNGESMTPREYLDRVVRLNLDDYVCVQSFMQHPWYSWCKFDVPDNWWHSREYYNVPLTDFVRLVREATAAGHTVCINIDDGEPGWLPSQDVAFIPSFDIPPEAIDDDARQLRFTNGSTTDDHVVHLVGYGAGSGRDFDELERWYLIKDSGTYCRNGRHGGYMFYHEDYIRLKTLCLMLHRGVVEKALGRSLAPPASPR